MKKIIIAPDSFKGTMSSAEICSIMARAVKKHYPDASVISVPVADGGEGTVDAFLAAVGGKRINVIVQGPDFYDIESFYGILSDGTAVIEIAAAAGLHLVGDDKNPEKTTTFGVGELIGHAIENGAKRIILGLGGSATNDGGCGAAVALGAKFYNNDGNTFVPTGGTLGMIKDIDLTELSARLDGVEFSAMCDIDNPICGKDGAAAVFAPQKGANLAMVIKLDKGLRHLADIIWQSLGQDLLDMKGGGAAGGMGGGCFVFFGAKLQMGIDTILDTVGFDAMLADASLVFTGEGRLDSQSKRGKVVYGVASRCKKHNVPLIVVAGDIGDIDYEIYEMGISSVFSTNRAAIPFSEASARAGDDLYLTMDNIMRCIKSLRKA